MKDLSAAQGIGNSIDYINGNLVTNQTNIGIDVNQDMVQFFQKLAALAGTVFNGDFDNETNGYQLIEALQDFIGGTKNILVPLGDWNMDATGTLTLNVPFASLGVTFADIVGVSGGLIVNDQETNKYPISYINSTGPGSEVYVSTLIDFGANLQIVVVRKLGGFFDGTSFNATDFNRGWITLEVMPST